MSRNRPPDLCFYSFIPKVRAMQRDVVREWYWEGYALLESYWEDWASLLKGDSGLI